MKLNGIELIILFMSGVLTGSALMSMAIKSDVEDNAVEGYHCTPITKHTGIESAKAQVAKYQAMVRG